MFDAENRDPHVFFGPRVADAMCLTTMPGRGTKLSLTDAETCVHACYQIGMELVQTRQVRQACCKTAISLHVHHSSQHACAGYISYQGMTRNS